MLNIFLSDNLSNDISENNGVDSKQKEVRNGSTNTITHSINQKQQIKLFSSRTSSRH
ncbi:hypothetical protein OENI_550002 [Oenococcus oeni]|nr:hypothetical protein OENI_550002 [Oenococcus oeni]